MIEDVVNSCPCVTIDGAIELPILRKMYKGDTGDSAYAVWLKNGNEGTVEDFFNSVKGNPFMYEDFTQEQLNDLKGADGKTPVKGEDYFDGEKGEKGNRGFTWRPEVTDAGVLTWENNDSTDAPLSINIKGSIGEKGEKGDQGVEGIQGITGLQGNKGDKGDKGDTGSRGEQGVQGVQGVKGDIGLKGDKGEGLDYNTMTPEEKAYLKGDKGEPGEQGIQGEFGAKGDTGAKGEKGAKGDTGAQGERGIQGAPGAKGDTGARGADGYSYQGTKGDTGDKGDQGIQGEKGEKGDKGDVGNKGDTGVFDPTSIIPTLTTYNKTVPGAINELNSGKADTSLSNVTLTKYFSLNGYYKAPDGLMIQWGKKQGGANTTTYYPASFKSIYSVVNNPYVGASENSVVTNSLTEISESYFKTRSRWTMDGAGAGDSSAMFSWIAIGTWK